MREKVFAKDLTSDKRISIMEEAYDIESIAQISDECDETKERMLGLMKKLYEGIYEIIVL